MKKTSRLGMRVLPQDKARWEAAAEHAGMSLSAWIEAWLNMASEMQTQMKTHQKRKSDE